MSDSLQLSVYSPPGSSVHGILQARYWSGLPCPPPGDLPNPGTEPASLTPPALAGRFFTFSDTWENPLIPTSFTKPVLTDNLLYVDIHLGTEPWEHEKGPGDETTH